MTARRRLRTAVAGALVAVVVLGLGLGACGIPEDSEPREISREGLPPELIDPSAESPPDTDAELSFVTLYLVDADESDGESLVAVRRAVPMPSEPDAAPEAVVQALIDASPEDLGRTDVVNAIPSDVQVQSADLGDDGVLDLDLSNLGNVESALQRLAVAQLIYTLTDLEQPTIRGIRFLVDGEPVAVPIEGGVAPPGTVVTRADDAGLAPRPSGSAAQPG